MGEVGRETEQSDLNIGMMVGKNTILRFEYYRVLSSLSATTTSVLQLT